MNHEMKQLREEWKTAEQEEGIKGNGKLEKDKQSRCKVLEIMMVHGPQKEAC